MLGFHPLSKLWRRSLAAALCMVASAPGLATADDGRGHYRIAVGAGAVSHEETHAFDRTSAADVSVTGSGRRKWLLIDLGWQGRFGTHVVPLVTDVPYGVPATSVERRHGVSLGAAWTGGLGRLGPADLEVLAGLTFRHETLDRMVAPHYFGVVGPRVGLSLVRDSAALVTSFELGLPTYDSTPDSLAAGAVKSRVAWTAGVEWKVAASTRFALTYRGELLNRAFSERRSDGAMVELILGFGGGTATANRRVSTPDPDGERAGSPLQP